MTDCTECLIRVVYKGENDMKKLVVLMLLVIAVSFANAKEYVYSDDDTNNVYVLSKTSDTSGYIESLYEKHNVYSEGQAKKTYKIKGGVRYVQVVVDSIESELIVDEIEPLWKRMNNLGCNVLVRYNKALVGTKFETYHAYIITENTIEAIHYRK